MQHYITSYFVIVDPRELRQAAAVRRTLLIVYFPRSAAEAFAANIYIYIYIYMSPSTPSLLSCGAVTLPRGRLSRVYGGKMGSAHGSFELSIYIYIYIYIFVF